MSRMNNSSKQANTEQVTSCVTCGASIVQSKMGPQKEFCSETCRRQGRSFCKACGKPLIQQRGHGLRKIWCNDLCRMTYRRVGQITPVYFQEQNRSECVVCGKPISQTRYRRRKYCSGRCTTIYYRTGRNKQSLQEDWGVYPPETRKVLREIQLHMGIGAAKRLATAIDREYKLRRSPLAREK